MNIHFPQLIRAEGKPRGAEGICSLGLTPPNETKSYTKNIGKGWLRGKKIGRDARGPWRVRGCTRRA